MASAATSRAARALEGQILAQRQRFPASAARASALAHRCFLYQREWDLLYLFSVFDGYSRSIVHGDLRESMTEAEIEVILQRAREKYPEAKPRIISDNGPQFIARD